MSSHTIELNGKRYDALSGRPLGAAAVPVTRRSIDGVVSPPAPRAHHTPAPASAQPAAVHRPAPAPAEQAHHAPKILDIRRQHQVAQHRAARQPQHAHTLVRTAVRRPEASLKRRTKAIARTDILVKTPTIHVAPKYSIDHVDEGRLKRAQRIVRSKFITRFGTVHLQPAVAAAAARTASVAPVQIIPAVSARPISSDAIGRPAAHTAVSRQPSTDIFERALATATSHRQPPAPLKRNAKKTHRLRRVASVAASSLAILLIVGFIAYQNAASLQLRVAAARAGINASLPAWRPSGFTVGKLSYHPGTVAINFTDTGSGSRGFSLVQTASNWDSSALLEQYVYPNNQSYNTVSAAGNTIYTYGNNNATWVSGGIWYTLTTDGSLSTSQIVRIATSM